MDAYLSKMVRAVEAATQSSQQYELLRRCGKDLLARPDLCAGLIHEAKDRPLSDTQRALLTAALDEARMADENGQRKGRAFLDDMRDAVALLDTELACLMTFLGSWGKREPLPATPFMAGSGGGWIANSLVYQDR